MKTLLRWLVVALFAVSAHASQLPYCINCSFVYSAGVYSPISYPNATSTTVEAISAAGILGVEQTSGQSPQSFIYSNGNYLPLPTIPPPPINGLVSRPGMNDAGTIVSGQSVYSPSGDLNIPGALLIYGQGINNSGQIVGEYMTFDPAYGDVTHGFVLSNGVYQTVDAPFGTGTQTFLLGVNDFGSAIGIASLQTNSGFQDYAFLYQGGQFTDLNYPDSSTVLAPAGINNSGVIVGYIIPNGSRGYDYQGFLYSNGAFTTLNYPGASSTELLGIDNNGDIIGRYTFVPEPPSLSLGFIAICVVAGCFRLVRNRT